MGNNIEGQVASSRASSGLGEATARHLSAHGASVVLAFAMSQPEEVDVNEILFRPTRQDL